MNNNGVVLIVALLGGTALFHAPARGDTVYDNGTTNHASAYTLSLTYTVADDFVLSDVTTLNGISLLTVLDPLTQVESIDWQVLKYDGGNLGPQVAAGNAPVSAADLTNTGEPWGFNQVPEYWLRFTLPNVTIDAGKYWLALHANTSGAGNLYWETAHGNATHLGYQYNDSGYFRSDVAQFTFSLDGERPSIAASTPLPSVATGGVVLFGGALLRCRRRVK